ncbi:MAG: hemolysin III family protein [Verrucomicrobiales bacterium]|nr:hemolysin III family protein [Verrucomicrobiales bacterium]
MSERSELCESPEEELSNAISHGIGAILSVVGLVIMVKLAVPLSGWHVTSVAVFGSSLILLYTASTVYHLVTTHRLKRIFQILDHALIFVLIAGSYTPWLLVNLRGPWGWSLFFVVWGIALAGMILKAFFLPRFQRLGAALYVVMGWIVCIAIKPLIESVGPIGMSWLVAGGLCYTGGVAFFLMKRKYSHLIWHLFVMAGSICHVIAVVTGVIGDQ